MDWIKRLNEAINFIEGHLTEKIDCNELAGIAGCSAYYFQRVFLYITGITLNEYIRLRRLSMAAVELQKNGARILDISLKYGYDSPTAFNRAFKKFHGIAPSAVKEENAGFKSYPPVKFSVSVQGGQALDFRIEKKEPFRVLGRTCPLDKELEKNFQVIPKMWDRAAEDGTLDELALLMNGRPKGLLGVSVHNGDDWRYFIAVSSDKRRAGFEDYDIPSCTWAVFSGKGTNVSLQELERRVIVEWLPTSGYRYADIPDIEVYIKADPNDAVYEYWLPIV